MAAQYRVKPVFGSNRVYMVEYVIQKRRKFFGWKTISEKTTLAEAEKDCDEAQRLYDKYWDGI